VKWWSRHDFPVPASPTKTAHHAPVQLRAPTLKERNRRAPMMMNFIRKSILPKARLRMLYERKPRKLL
jgi:hypothetical protein